jgi:hypothetical protein
LLEERYDRLFFIFKIILVRDAQQRSPDIIRAGMEQLRWNLHISFVLFVL